MHLLSRFGLPTTFIQRPFVTNPVKPSLTSYIPQKSYTYCIYSTFTPNLKFHTDAHCHFCFFHHFIPRNRQRTISLIVRTYRRIMWRNYKFHNTLKEECFDELYEECRHNPPSSNLSYNLRNKLIQLHPEVRKEVTNRIKSGCSPFFVACRRGQAEVVQFLILYGCANLEQRGQYEVVDERSVHQVTPLWCAAVSGRLSVVEVLLNNGANINALSDTGSTPVRSACFMTHLDVVKYLVQKGADINKPNYNGGTCLINSVQSVELCRFLLDNGADVNARDIQSKTALHYAIQEHRLETTALLLNRGADHTATSRYGDDALQTACLKGARSIFEFLIETIQYPIERLANSHELIGSTCLDEHNDLYGALNHWNTAMTIRANNPDLLPKQPVVSTRAAFHHQKEFSSYEDLEAVITDIDSIRMQSLLITERILGPSHKDTVFRLMFRGASYVDVLRFQRCIDLWRRALEIRVEKDSLLYSDTCFTAQALVRLLIDFNERHATNDLEESSEDQKFDDIIGVFKLLTEGIIEARELAITRPPHKRQMDSFDRVLKCVTHLIYLMLEAAKTDAQKNLVNDLIGKLMSKNLRAIMTEDTLLHLCVSKLNTLRSSYFMDAEPVLIFPNLNVIKYLLEIGAPVNARNNSNSTPLHIATTTYNYSTELVKMLLDYGAHVDLPNAQGERPSEKIKKQSMSGEAHLLNYISLQCLSANTICEFKIPYINEVPIRVADFIRQHEVK